MGCAQSSEESMLKKKSDEIDAALQREKANLHKEVKMLLLGNVIMVHWSIYHLHLRFACDDWGLILIYYSYYYYILLA